LLFAFPISLALTMFTNVSGELVQDSTWPPAVPVGTTVYFQNAVQDPAALAGVSLSNGLHGVYPKPSPRAARSSRDGHREPPRGPAGEWLTPGAGTTRMGECTGVDGNARSGLQMLTTSQDENPSRKP
jgi:hypothetical protein